MICPTMVSQHGIPRDCQGDNCLWFSTSHDKCAILVLAENNKPIKNIRVDIGKYDGSDL